MTRFLVLLALLTITGRAQAHPPSCSPSRSQFTTAELIQQRDSWILQHQYQMMVRQDDEKVKRYMKSTNPYDRYVAHVIAQQRGLFVRKEDTAITKEEKAK